MHGELQLLHRGIRWEVSENILQPELQGKDAVPPSSKASGCPVLGVFQATCSRTPGPEVEDSGQVEWPEAE